MSVWYDEKELRGGFVGNAFWFSWEPGVIIFLQSCVTPLLQKFFEAVTFFGDEYAIILVIGFLYWGYKKDLGKRIGLYFVTALMTTETLHTHYRPPDYLRPRLNGTTDSGLTHDSA